MQEQRQTIGDAPRTLRLFAPEGDIGPAITLAGFYQRFGRPALVADDAAAGTLVEYATSLAHWESITGDPPLGHVDQETCRRFVAVLQGRPGRLSPIMSPRTVRKHCVQLQRLLDQAGPVARYTNAFGPVAEGCYGVWEEGAQTGRPKDPPRLKTPRMPKPRTKNVLTGDEIARWLDLGTSIAIKPQGAGVAPRTWWESLLVTLYAVGLRIGTALGMEWDHIRWGDEGLWLEAPASILKGRSPEEFYINAAARRALESMRGHGPLVFPWPHGRRCLDRERVQQQKHAGIRQIGFHGIRKRRASDLLQHNPAVAQKAMGHAASAMTRDFYSERAVVVETMERVQPKPRRRRRADDPAQKRLFD